MKQTQKQARNLRHESIKNRVCELLRITPEQYHTVQWEVAERYMQERLNYDEQFVSAFFNEPKFWNWWRQQWALVDEQFLHENRENRATNKVLLGLMHSRWTKQHESIDTYPDKVIYNKVWDSYEKVTDQLTRNGV